jgi:hypothetical protein
MSYSARMQELKQDVSRKLLPLLDGWEASMSDMVLALSECIDHPTVVEAVRSTGIRSSTLNSRCARAGLPSPKVVHQHLRLYAILVLAREHRSVAAMTGELGQSSPQALARVVRAQTGKGTREFIATPPGDYWDRFVAQVLLPDAEGWRHTSHRARVAA